MELRVDKVVDLIRSLQQEASRGPNKRSAVRVGVRARAEVFPFGVGIADSRLMRGWVRDISSRGIGLTLGAELPGHGYLVVGARDTGNIMKGIVYRCAYCRKVATSSYLVGGELLDDEQFKTAAEIYESGPLKCDFELVDLCSLLRAGVRAA